MTKKSFFKRAILVFLIFVPVTAFSMPMTFFFEQSGFSEGASVSGWFNGVDLNDNGQLSSLDGEIDDFHVSFSGNSLVSQFELNYVDLAYLVYDLNSRLLGSLFNDEGIEAFNGSYEYLAGPAIFFTECGIGFDCAYVAGPALADIDFSTESISVPEPASVLLMLVGILGIGLVRRRHLKNLV